LGDRALEFPVARDRRDVEQRAVDRRDRDALVGGGVLGIEGACAVQADPRGAVAAAVTSMRVWSVLSRPQCAAAVRWESTAPGPQASTAANLCPSARSAVWPRA
jgi:hypothetical protein